MSVEETIYHFRKGFALGWQQPHELRTGWTPNNPRYDEVADKGTCWGQLLRKGKQSQVWREGMYPRVPAKERGISMNVILAAKDLMGQSGDPVHPEYARALVELACLTMNVNGNDDYARDAMTRVITGLAPNDLKKEVSA